MTSLRLILLCSFITTLISLLLSKLLVNKDLLKTLEAKTKIYQGEVSQHKNSPQEMFEIQTKLMALNRQKMFQILKPSFFMILIIIFLFRWLSKNIDQRINIFGINPTWITVYILSSILFGVVISGAIKSVTTPKPHK